MIGDLLTQVTGFVTHTIDTFGYVGVATLMAIESAAVPLPSEVIMPFAGFVAAMGRFNLFGLALAGAIGSVIGSWLTYALGYYGGRPLVERFGKYVLITHHDLNLAERFFQKFGAWSTFIGRLLPVVRTFISVPAGISREPLGSFTIAAFAGSFIWSYFLAWLGMKLGENWHILGSFFHKFDLGFGILVSGLIIWWIQRHWKHRVRG
ncbi:MAG: DedA family protein [Candidatus Doudnabacteria bacterium]|nr:DedA family protein [Candidatus Doudnabacteria bacterium]